MSEEFYTKPAMESGVFPIFFFFLDICLQKLPGHSVPAPRDVLEQAGGFCGPEGQFLKHSYENAIRV